MKRRITKYNGREVIHKDQHNMAQKYLMALDYVDTQANNILKKHAKKRPLGDIETKHRYTPTQPVLSCRTVDIDVSGTRTYRPKSSADIITEQHALIHRIYSKSRNISSAPPRRSKTPRNNVKQENNKNTNKENKLKSVEVQGRPLTSLSQRPPTSSGRASKGPNNKRPKTTGGIKPAEPIRDSFMIVRADREIIETRRSHRNLTEKIHKQWKPEAHDLNTGTFQRGKKPPGIPSIDSWLTFNGAQGEESQGLVDAFADLDRQGEYYNIESGVGSRIAQQLQQGDSIRIGINGNVQTQDLKVKKWNKEDSFVNTDRLESTESEIENMAKKEDLVIPLSWTDQLENTQAKILTPRDPPAEKATINLCETRPVVFQKLLPDDNQSQAGTSAMTKKDGFRVKQRKKNKPGVDGKEKENKVTVLTIDSKSEEEEKKIESLTVDEVLKQSVNRSEKTNGYHDEGEKHSVTFSLNEPDGPIYHDTAFTQSRVSVTDSISSVGSDHKHLKIKPSQPTFSTKYQEVDLDIIGTLSVPNGTRPLASEEDQAHLFTNRTQLQSRSQIIRGSSARSRSSLKSAKSGQNKLGSGSLVNIGSSAYKQNEAEFIQISHPMKTPIPASPKKSVEFTNQGMPTDMRNQRGTSGIREPVPSPELNLDEIETQEPPPTPSVHFRQIHKSTAQALSINIPTADYTDSALNSPSHKQIPEPTSSPQMRRAKDMRDEQIDQITSLLVDAIIGPDGTNSGTS